MYLILFSKNVNRFLMDVRSSVTYLTHGLMQHIPVYRVSLFFLPDQRQHVNRHVCAMVYKSTMNHSVVAILSRGCNSSIRACCSFKGVCVFRMFVPSRLLGDDVQRNGTT